MNLLNSRESSRPCIVWHIRQTTPTNVSAGEPIAFILKKVQGMVIQTKNVQLPYIYINIYLVRDISGEFVSGPEILDFARSCAPPPAPSRPFPSSLFSSPPLPHCCSARIGRPHLLSPCSLCSIPAPLLHLRSNCKGSEGLREAWHGHPLGVVRCARYADLAAITMPVRCLCRFSRMRDALVCEQL